MLGCTAGLSAVVQCATWFVMELKRFRKSWVQGSEMLIQGCGLTGQSRLEVVFSVVRTVIRALLGAPVILALLRCA